VKNDGPYSVAILDFKKDGSNVYVYHGGDAGKIIPAALTTELANSPRFTVVERTQLEAVLREQGVGISGAVNAENAARLGELLGCEYLILGDIVELNIEEGKSSSFGFMGIGGSSKQARKAHVSIEVKVVDTESARLVAAVNCRKTYDVGKGSGSASVAGLINSSNHDDGNVDNALADVYYRIVKDIADQLNTVPFKKLPAKAKLTGCIVHSENDTCYINMGKNQGITRKMVFLVRREIEKAGGVVKVTLGEIQASVVDDDSTECTILEQKEAFKDGDLVITKF
ncbi:hypothetical protein IJT10_04910, partial [bacterium]|nr:hypothetical protein [bacterium]